MKIAHVAGDMPISRRRTSPVKTLQIIEGDIPRQPPGFQPREALLHLLHNQVAGRGSAVVSALTGTPGVGKTVLAASYAWACHAAGWQAVVWVPAETEGQIIAGLASLAGRLGLRGADDGSTAAAQKAKKWLADSSRPSLLVFDNAVDVEHIHRWCPPTGPAHVVITSRNRAFQRLYPPVDVEVFTPAEAVAFLQARTGSTDEVGASLIAEELGYLPLALAQAAAVVAGRGIGYEEYLDLLSAVPLADHPPPGDGHPTGTAQAILLSAEAVAHIGPDAHDLLNVLAVLSPAGVRRRLLYGGAVPDPTRRTRIDDLLSALADASLITCSEDDATILMHRLVQRVLRDRAERLGESESAIMGALAHLKRFNAIIPQGAETWSARADVEELVDQCMALSANVPPHHPRYLDVLDLQHWCGQYLVNLADLSRALPLLAETLAQRVRLLGPDHPDSLMSRSILASAHAKAGRPDQAIPLHESTLAGRRRVLGDNHIDTLRTQNNLANAYRAAGDVNKAIALYESVLADFERLCGSDHRDTMSGRNNLATAYRDAGRAKDAVPLLERTVADSERVLGEGHPETLSRLNNLAMAYEAAGRVDEAVTVLEKALSDCQRLLAEDHPYTLTCMSNLAAMYQLIGRMNEAIAMYKSSLSKRERVLGPDHPDTFTSRHNLATAYQTVGRLNRAATLYERTLSDCERVLSPGHPQTLNVRATLAALRRDMQVYYSASWWRRLIKIWTPP
ncbi:tetratricopeptide repeat protein [Sinosporangium album]|nr:tetratricopeptide repeat protein [Sinosporangium album]